VAELWGSLHSDSVVIPVALPPLTFESVGVLAQVRQVEELKQSKAVDKLRDKLVAELGLNPSKIKSDRWTEKKESFLDVVNQQAQSTQQSPVNTPPVPIPQPPAMTSTPNSTLTVKTSKGTSANRLLHFNDWHITNESMRNGHQNANFLALPFGSSTLSSLSGRIHIKADYMRFGVKFRRVEDGNFSPTGAIGQPGSVLFHIGKEEGDHAIHAWVVRDEPRAPKLHVCPASIGDTVRFELNTRGNSSVGYSIRFSVNGLLQFTEAIPPDAMSNIVLLAWRDSISDAAVEVTDLVITARRS